MKHPPSTAPTDGNSSATPTALSSSAAPVASEDDAKPPDSGLRSHDQSQLEPDGARHRSDTLTSTVPSTFEFKDAQVTAHDATAVGDPATLAATRGHIMTPELLFDTLKSTTQGLSATDATERLARHGPNVVTEQKPTSALTIFVRQVANCLTIVLLAAMALSFGVQDWVEGGVVLAVIVTNIVIGFTQEWKAERTMASLRDLSSPTACVYRDGELRTLPSSQLVPGDVITFRTGDVLPADVRLTAHTNLETSEAALTGESVPVAKTLDTLFDPTLTLGPADRINLAYSSTVVTKGRGTGIVIATGRQTQIGQIAEEMATRQSRQGGFWSRAWDKTATLLGLRQGTPLQIKLNKFAYILLALAVLCAIIVFSVAEFELDSDILLYAIALGIGVIPESLIPVLTITFSVGAKRMAESGVVVRRIEALEALGGVTNICSDKTGTLTQGKMVVRKIWLDECAEYEVEEAASAFEPVGRIAPAGTSAHLDNANLPGAARKLATAASLCNIAELLPPDAERTAWSARGDPTEIALLVMATKLGFSRPQLLGHAEPTSEKKSFARFQLLNEYPFDSDVKLMTTVYLTPEGEEQAFMKGAVERVLPRCDDMAEPERQRITEQAERLAGQGLRVLAFASRTLKGACGTRSSVECNMSFLGLCALYDPPRPTSLPAVLACQKAGITVSMLTGDHAATARAIAREVGILPSDHSEPHGAVMTAQEFESLSETQVDALPTLPLVIARCSPSTKVRMVQAGRRRGLYIAMTGDGVNDAPALKQAPIGIAMGSGTDVAKSAASLVLTDDCFESIVQAVREGRTIFDNIQRFIIALLVANVGEVILLLVGLAFQDQAGESVFALTAVQILWANMVTASLPAVGLGMEVPSAEIMDRPPIDGKAGVFSKLVVVDMLVYGFQMGWTCLVVFVVMVYAVGNGDLGVDCNGSSNVGGACDVVFQARSAVFTALILENLIVAWAMHSLEGTLLSWKAMKHVARNRILFWSVIFGAATIPLCLYVPRFNSDVFHHGPLRGIGWGVALAATAVFTASVEAWKWAARRGGWPWLTRVSGGTVAQVRSVNAEEKA